MRLDVYLAKQGICNSRTLAQSLINLGCVTVNGRIAGKSSLEVSEADTVEIIELMLPRYVGRGGLKLEKALEYWNISVEGAVCLDIGASTGGFTDCMLRHGASKVFAVDVGTAQLAEKLRNDSRVISLEKTDIRDFSFDGFSENAADFIGTDVSFISLKLVLPHVFRLLREDGEAVALIKPQFEAGRSALSKKGIVRNSNVRQRVVEEISEFAGECGFSVLGKTESPITGGDGNVEYLLYIRKERR